MGKALRKAVKAAAALGAVAGGVLSWGVVDYLRDPGFSQRGRKPEPSPEVAPGRAWVEPSLVRAGEGSVTVTLRFRCGREGMEEGGGLKVCLCRLVDYGPRGRRQTFLYGHGWGMLQNRHPRMPNYYRCALHSEGAARLEVAPQGYLPLRGAVRFLGRDALRRCGVKVEPLDVAYLYLEERKLRIRVRGDRLREGDEIRVVLGNRSRGSVGWRSPAHPSRVDLAVEVDEKGTGDYRLIAASPALEAVAGRAEALQPVLCGFDGEGGGRLLLRAVDGRGDVDPTFTGEVSLLPSPGLEMAGAACFREEDRGVVCLPCRAREAGIHRVEARAERKAGEGGAGTLRGESNPALCGAACGGEGALSEGGWGKADLHVHTCLCDGTLEPREFYMRARDEEGLDFAAITMHDTMEALEPSGREEEWELVRELQREFDQPGRFVALLGYEWSDHKYGHRGVFFAPHEPDPRPYAFPHPESDDPWKLQRLLAWHEALVVPHHTAWRRIFLLPFNWAKFMRMKVPPAYTWWDAENQQQRLVEIYSMHGAAESHTGPFPITHGDPRGWFPSRLRDDRVAAGHGNYFQEALAAGLRLGVIAGSDRHDYAVDERIHPVDVYPRGLTAVWADELSYEGIWRALWNRRVYGTSGARIILELFADGLPMGTEYLPLAPPRLRGRVVGTASLRKVELMRYEGGRWTHAWTACGGREAAFEFVDREPATERIYYLRAEQEDGHCAWSSPIWLLR